MILKLLKSNKVCILDDVDFQRISKDFPLSRWASWEFNKGYVKATCLVAGVMEYVMIHNLIMNHFSSNDGLIIDHINRDKLDNRRENLRLVSYKINRLNSNQYKNINRKFGVKYIGVRYNPSSENYRAIIKIRGKSTHIGTYKTEVEAALAYNEVAIKLNGIHAQINNIT